MSKPNAPSPAAIAKATELLNSLACRFDDPPAHAMAVATLAMVLDAPEPEDGLEWKAEPARIAAYSGNVAIGAIFPGPGNIDVRWRVWFGGAIHPHEGAARSDTAAKYEVAMRFWRFVHEAGLQRKGGT